MNKMLACYYGLLQRRLGIKLGFSIAKDALGYGVVIPHYGTIVVGGGNKIGNYSVLHTSTCITHGQNVIGDMFYLSTGAKIIGDGIRIGNNVSVSANSVVNKSIPDSNILLAGSPANIKKNDYLSWTERDGAVYARRVLMIEQLREILK